MEYESAEIKIKNFQKSDSIFTKTSTDIDGKIIFL